MKFLQATDIDGTTEFFNLDKIISIRPLPCGERVKILMGAGLYWTVTKESIKIVNLEDIIK